MSGGDGTSVLIAFPGALMINSAAAASRGVVNSSMRYEGRGQPAVSAMRL